MNIHDRFSAPNGEAKLHFTDSDFQVVRPGSFVRCAVSGRSIPLDELRYWSAAHQEAYWSAVEAVEAARARGELPDQRQG
jgi:hypothetical protein